MNQMPKRIGMSVAFFGGMIAMLVVQDNMLPSPTAMTIITQDVATEAPAEHNVAPEVTCDKNEDCPLPIEYCSQNGVCTPLENPVCTCAQQKVLRCTERASGKAKHSFCKNGCFIVDGNAICS